MFLQKHGVSTYVEHILSCPFLDSYLYILLFAYKPLVRILF